MPRSRYPNYIGRDIHTLHRPEDKSSYILRSRQRQVAAAGLFALVVDRASFTATAAAAPPPLPRTQILFASEMRLLVRATTNGGGGGGSATPVYEWVVRTGQLSCAWEAEYLASRQAAFEATGGLPLAFEKREVAEGYAELEYVRFASEELL